MLKHLLSFSQLSAIYSFVRELRLNWSAVLILIVCCFLLPSDASWVWWSVDLWLSLLQYPRIFSLGFATPEGPTRANVSTSACVCTSEDYGVCVCVSVCACVQLAAH